MKLTQYQKDALTLLRSYLDTDDPAFRGSDKIHEAFGRDATGTPGVAHLYIQTWVLPLLDVIAGESSYHRQRDDVARNAAETIVRREKAARS
jgi:hypothetical protein